jgi:capsular exopolysaccharide synthesis family protein
MSMHVGPDRPAQAPANEARLGAGLEIGDLLRILSERRYIIISAAALGLVLAIIASLLMTPLFRASALLELNPPSSEVIEQASGSQRSPTGNGPELMATQLGLLRSDSLARRVAQDLNLIARPEYGGEAGSREERLDRAAAVIQGNTLVDTPRGSMLIQVSYSSPDPALASRVANALADGFMTSSLERRYDSSSYARDFLRDQLNSTKTALEESERQLNDYAIRSGIFRAPASVSNGVVTEGASLDATNLQAVNGALNDARIKRIAAEEALRNGGPETGASVQTATAPLRQQRAMLQAEYNDKRQVFREDYPEMLQLSQRIKSLDSAISAERAGTAGSRRADLAAEYRAALSAEQEMQARLAALKQTVQGERSRSIQYNILQREVDTNRGLYDALLQRYKEIGVAGGIGQSNVSLVDRAEVPRAPYRPNMVFNGLIGIAAGLALGVLTAVAVHLLLDTIVTPNDVRTKLALPVLGVIPEESGDRSLFDSLADQKSDVSEAYFSVRTALRFSSADGAPRSLLITSTRPGEGKSTSAYAIASSFARTGANVLLVDADLRKPTFVSRQQDGRGLAHLLASDEPLAEFIEETGTTGLQLLPVGRYSGSAAELLASSRLPRIMEEAAKSFQLVVFDGPPVLGLSDAPLLGALTEKTVIVIESRNARTANVSEMIRRMRGSGSDIIGVILTKVRTNAGGYNYYSYSYGGSFEGGHVSSDPARALDVNA